MQQKNPIKLKEALRIMDQRDVNGMPLPFQIAFYPMSRKLSQFKRIELSHAVRCGLPAGHVTKRHLVGVRPVLRSKHPYSVHTRLIVEFNHTPVIP